MERYTRISIDQAYQDHLIPKILCVDLKTKKKPSGKPVFWEKFDL